MEPLEEPDNLYREMTEAATALMEAGVNRFRPVLLTTVTTIGGLLPLFLNISGGAEFYHGFADYDLTVEAPAGWLVAATGALQNPDDVLALLGLGTMPWREVAAASSGQSPSNRKRTETPAAGRPLGWRWTITRALTFSPGR